jgi:hypothetical protein
MLVLTYVDLFIAAVNKNVPVFGGIGGEHIQFS